MQRSSGSGSASSSVQGQASVEPQPMQHSAGLGQANCEQMMAELPPGLGQFSAACQPGNVHLLGLHDRRYQASTESPLLLDIVLVLHLLGRLAIGCTSWN